MKRDLEAVLCGYYGFGNLGDELLAQAMVYLYEKNGIPAKRLAILSADPAGSAVSLGIHGVNRWNPHHVWKTLCRSRTLLLGGGGLFQDSTSLRSCLYYWGIIRMALLAGCRVWMFGQSVGPLKSDPAIFLARNGIGKCLVRVVRDSYSEELLRSWKQSVALVPDPVLALSCGQKSVERGKHVLVNIRPWTNPGLPEKVFSSALEVSSESGLPVRVVAMAPEDEDMAGKYLSEKGIRDIEVCRVRRLDDVFRVWSGAGCAFGMRLHFCILSVLMGVPCLAVPYDPKVNGFCSSHSVPVWDMKSKPDLMSLPDMSSEGMLMTERSIIEEIFGRSLKEV